MNTPTDLMTVFTQLYSNFSLIYDIKSTLELTFILQNLQKISYQRIQNNCTTVQQTDDTI